MKTNPTSTALTPAARRLLEKQNLVAGAPETVVETPAAPAVVVVPPLAASQVVNVPKFDFTVVAKPKHPGGNFDASKVSREALAEIVAVLKKKPYSVPDMRAITVEWLPLTKGNKFVCSGKDLPFLGFTTEHPLAEATDSYAAKALYLKAFKEEFDRQAAEHAAQAATDEATAAESSSDEAGEAEAEAEASTGEEDTQAAE